MKIRYAVELDDVQAFCQYYVRSSPVVQRQRMAFALCFATLLLFLVLHLVRRDGSSIPLAMVAVIGLVFLFAFWKYFGTVSLKRLAEFYPIGENQGLLCGHSLELTDTGITETSPVGQQHTAFTGICRVVSTPSHAFIFIGSNMAHVIPRRRMLEGNVDEFIARLEVRLKPNPCIPPPAPQGAAPGES